MVSPTVEPSVQQDTLIMFGDSITQGSFCEGGTGASLAELYQRAYDVQNRGLGGYNTKWCIPVAKKWLPRVGEDRPKTALMTIWFGANDSVHPEHLQTVPLPDFKANLHSIISFIRSPDSPYYSPTTSLLLLTPPPVDAAKWHANLLANVTPEIAARLTPDRSAENTQRYAQAVKEVGFEAGVPVVDVWTAIAAAAGAHPEGLGAFLSDGLHLTVAGYRIVTDVVKDTINTQLPDLRWETVPRHYPHWGDIPNGALGDKFRIPPVAPAEA